MEKLETTKSIVTNNKFLSVFIVLLTINNI